MEVPSLLSPLTENAEVTVLLALPKLFVVICERRDKMTIDKVANSGMNRHDFVAVAAASVAAVSAESEAAFAELHRLYARRLYSTIFSIMKNHEDAEDVLQETLMRAYLALGSFECRSKLYSG